MNLGPSRAALALVVVFCCAAGRCSCPAPGGQQTDGGSGDAGADAGACVPRYGGPSSAVANQLNEPRRLVLDGTFIDVTERGTLRQSNGRLLRVPLPNGPAQPLLSGLESPEALAADDSSIFVLEAAGLWKVSKTTGQTSLIDPVLNNAQFGGTEVLLADPYAVIATGLAWLHRVGKDGSSGTDLYTGPGGTSVQGAALEAGQVYFLVSGNAQPGVYRVPVDGSRPPQRVRDEPANGRSLLLTPTDFVWTEGNGGAGKVRSAPRDGGAGVDLATGLQAPERLVLTGDALYLKDSTLGTGPSNRFLLQIPSCSPGAAVPVGPTGFGPGDLAVQDGGALYFTSQGSGGQGMVGALP